MPETLMTPPSTPPLNRPDWFDRHLMIRFPVRRPTTLLAGDLSASAETPLMHELALHNARPIWEEVRLCSYGSAVGLIRDCVRPLGVANIVPECIIVQRCCEIDFCLIPFGSISIKQIQCQDWLFGNIKLPYTIFLLSSMLLSKIRRNDRVSKDPVETFY